MSFASTFRPLTTNTPHTDSNTSSMSVLDAMSSSTFTSPANSSANVPLHVSPQYLTLSRMLARFQHLILLTPSSPTSINSLTNDVSDSASLTTLQRQIQTELHTPLPYHRLKWLHQIENARILLSQLERIAQAQNQSGSVGIKGAVRSRKDVQKDLAEKKALIKRLRLRVEEIGREVENRESQRSAKTKRSTRGGHDYSDKLLNEDDDLDAEVWGDRADEVLGWSNKRRKVDGAANQNYQSLLQDRNSQDGKPIRNISEDSTNHEDKQAKEAEIERERNELFGGPTLRRRQQQQQQNHTADSTISSQTSQQGKSSGFSSLHSTEKSLQSSAETHESLTTSLVSMAAQLKQQSRAFQFSLDQDKNLLDRALEGLDKNIGGMELASKNLGALRRMSEGEGWWGRLKLYGIIFGGWIVALLVVFVMPKLRF